MTAGGRHPRLCRW